MNVAIDDIDGEALDWVVASILGKLPDSFDDWTQRWPAYSRNYNVAENILNTEIDQISRLDTYPRWRASRFACDDWPTCEADGDTILIAVMRCFAKSKLGQTAKIPQELT